MQSCNRAVQGRRLSRARETAGLRGASQGRNRFVENNPGGGYQHAYNGRRGEASYKIKVATICATVGLLQVTRQLLECSALARISLADGLRLHNHTLGCRSFLVAPEVEVGEIQLHFAF